MCEKYFDVTGNQEVEAIWNCQGCEVEKLDLFTSVPCLALYEATVLRLVLCQHTRYVCHSPV